MHSEFEVNEIELKIGITGKQAAKCAEHGDFIAILSRNRAGPSGCPVCADIERDKRDEIAAKELSAKIAKDKIERLLGSSLIPTRFQGKTFANYRAESQKQKAALAMCTEYAHNFRDHYDAGRCLLLLGNVGTGKTHLAAAIAEYLITEKGAAAVYRTLYSLMQYIKGSYDKHAEYTEAKAYENLITPHLLIIDEIGATKTTEFEQAALFNIINGRYEEQLPTVIISNLMPNELAGSLGERCVDRLREAGGLCQVFDWKSARKVSP